HRDSAAGRGQHPGRAAVEAVRRRSAARAHARRHLHVHRRAVHAAGATAAFDRPAAHRHRRRLTMRHLILSVLASASLAACGAGAPEAPSDPPRDAENTSREFHGTLEPFASHAVYFVLTDRFVNGDTGNDHRDQGGANRTFDIPLPVCDGVAGNIGYLGGDFRGLADNLDYIQGMGFGAVWITPIVDNPDESFTGGTPPGCDSILSDRGKSGYHGYWGVNFHRVDEHLPS